jgi:hypothetical protein
LVPVAYAAFTGGEVAPEVAFVCACQPTCPRLDARLLPHPGYLALCLEGAKEVGDEFARDFLRTTYLADGATDLETWLAKTGGS